MSIDFQLPMRFYRVGGTCFTDAQVGAMVTRTNSKLNSTGIEIVAESIDHVAQLEKAYISLNSKAGELEELLRNNGYEGPAASKTLRVFLVKVDLDNGDRSWTYDPGGLDEYESAIFLTELFNDNSDAAYEAQRYDPAADLLLHELGHALMWEAVHEGGAASNFFHYNSEYMDDTITSEQRGRMRGEDPGRPRDAPNYLRAIP